MPREGLLALRGVERSPDARAFNAPLYPLSYTLLDQYSCAQLAVGAPATKFIRTPEGGIFLLDSGTKRPISSMDRFAALGGSVGWTSVSAGLANSIPTGPAA